MLIGCPFPLLNSLLRSERLLLLKAFRSICKWDISHLQDDVDAALSCWNNWAHDYPSLLTEHELHSHGAGPCIQERA